MAIGTVIALHVTAKFCRNNEPIGLDNKCSDGSDPTAVEISICRHDYGDAIIHIERDGAVIFRLNGDGSCEQFPGFTVDAAAKAFWMAVAETLWQNNLDVGKVLEPLRNHAIQTPVV